MAAPPVSKAAVVTAWMPAMLAGIVSAAVLFAVAELAAAFFGPAASPFGSVGAAVVELSPTWLTEFAISTFGTADKLVLFIAMGIAAAVLAAGIGVLALRNWTAGALVVAALGTGMAVCVLTRAGAVPADAIPTALGTAVGLFCLRWLIRLLPGPAPANAVADSGTAIQRTDPDRRRFLATAGLMAGAAVVMGIAAGAVSAARNGARQVRETLGLPAPARPAKPLPEGVQAPVDGAIPFVTPNAEFYRIDTALFVPSVDPTQWTLRVHGLVEEDFSINFQDLLEADLVESYTTLTCVSNEVGGGLAGNARWLGYPLRELLARARPLPEADMVLSTSVDGFTASTPLTVLTDARNALLAIGMNGEPLPLEHGFPVRMVVPGLYGYVSATKWVVDLEITRFADKTAYWTSRGWSDHGPIKTASRIDVPRDGSRIAAGQTAFAGTAWAQHRGISKVQVQLDDGDWADVELAAEASVDTWRQWYWVPDGVSAGQHRLRVRAWDGDRTLQTETPAPPAPNGASGWHSIEFTAG
ncbi:molybdopterin-dependent oxidoreductase [Arthrobacter sulfonylureivorans]|uniref:molybdopterin-dependent oxidoreductase n=1 Tax=Arthrobacter sulfonylureivorans TaxID=2486855 RepID=UPI0039E2A777